MRAIERAGFLAHARGVLFQRKVAQALTISREAFAVGPAYIACSWGKDSLVMMHLAQTLEPGAFVLHLGDEHEDLLDNYTETQDAYAARFGLPNYSRLIFGGDSVPENLNISRVWENYPVAFVGLRAEEHPGRRIALKKWGTLHQYQTAPRLGSWRAAPLAWWSWRDVWAYICLHDLPYLASYDHVANADRAYSRTSVHIPVKRAGGPKGMRSGRIAKTRQFSPAYYAMLALHFPEIAAAG